MFDFETIVKRENCGSLKMLFTPEVLKQKGIVTFAAGEMDFPTAPAINEAIKKAAENGLYGFTLPDDYYLSTVQSWLEKVRDAKVEKDWIVTTLGTIYSLATAIKEFVKEDESIIVMPPYYSRYKQAADRLKRGTVYSPLVLENNRYTIDFENLEKLMSNPKNRLLVFSNPHNPSGTIFTKEELTGIARLSEKYGTIVVSDEIFAENLLTEEKAVCYVTIKEAQKYGISTTSLGKAFNCTGMNHANILIADEKLRERFADRRTNDHYGSIDPLAYAVTIGAYSEEGYKWLLAANEIIKENSRIVHEAMNKLGCPVLENKGSFVCWVDFSRFGLENEQLEQFLVDKALFHIDNGSDYGSYHPMYARVNLGSTIQQTKEAMERLLAVFEK